jgi:hypothetical protein
MNILIACEESQEVCKAFRAKGHTAYSCDLLPCSGGHPEWHLQYDVKYALKKIRLDGSSYWNKIISFQPCTDLSVSGARWFDKKRLSGEQEQSIEFFLDVWEYSNCTENPVNIMCGGKYIKKWFPLIWDRMKDINFPISPTQIIQPWQFGHGETKKTCLWLRGLPNLIPTDIVGGREQRIWKMPPSADRGQLRSKTFSGIAKAMAEQWG